MRQEVREVFGVLENLRLRSKPGRHIRRAMKGPLNWMLAAVSVTLFIAWLSVDAKLFPDSGGYLTSGDPAFGQLSFVGHSIRAWPTVLLFSNGVEIGIVLQSLIYLFAVAHWLRTVRRLMSGRARAIVGVLSLVYLLSRNTIQWHSIVLSESLTLSLTLLFVSLNLRLSREPRRAGLWLVSVFVGSLLILQRPTMIPLVALLATFVIMRLCVGGRWKSALCAVAVFGAGIGYSVLVNSNINDHWAQGQSGFSRSSVGFVFLTANDIDASRDDFLGAGLQWASDVLFRELQSDESVPRCLTTLRSSWVDCPYCFQNDIADSCPRDVAWINEDFSRWYARALVARPDRTAVMSAIALGSDAVMESRYAYPWSPIPRIVGVVFTGLEFPGSFPGIPPLPFWLVGAGVSVAAGVRRIRPEEGGRGLVTGVWPLVPVVMFVGSTLSIVITALALPADLSRTASGGVLAMFLSLFLLIGMSASGEAGMRSEGSAK